MRGQDSGPWSMPMSLGFFICKTGLYYRRHRATHGRMGETLGPAPARWKHLSLPSHPVPSPLLGPSLCWGLRRKPWRVPCAQLCQRVALAFAILHFYPGTRAAQPCTSHLSTGSLHEKPWDGLIEGHGYLGKRSRPQSRAQGESLLGAKTRTSLSTPSLPSALVGLSPPPKPPTA